jgi:caffeoyl-CoA O-methyltransferase
MQDLITSLYNYADRHSGFDDALLNELERATHLRTLAPRMLSGRIQGVFLQLISILTKPRAILEIGTFTGYSALCLARGLEKGGQLITLEVNPEHALIASEFFARSGHAKEIQLCVGDAKAIIPTLPQEWDLVFIDADKEAYGSYYDLVIDRCKPGSLILVDNVLWSGKVVEAKMDTKTRSLHEFNLKVSSDDRVENLLLPLRDGIQIIRKIS